MTTTATRLAHYLEEAGDQRSCREAAAELRRLDNALRVANETVERCKEVCNATAAHWREDTARLDAEVEALRKALAAPAAQAEPRKPLTDEQIEVMPVWEHFVGLWPETRREIVEAIEAAHGIKENP